MWYGTFGFQTQLMILLQHQTPCYMRYIISIIMFLLLGIAIQTKGQCGYEIVPDYLREKLGEYHEVKHYRVDGKGGQRQQIEYTIVLSKDTFYRFSMISKEGGSHGVILTIYNSTREKVIASNYHDDTFEDVIEFQVKATGMYYAVFTFKNSQRYCAMAILGF